jgi:hypothetical protein
MSKRNLLSAIAMLVFFTFSGNGIAQQASPPDYDIVILNGRVIDPETGLDAIRNIGVRGRKIETISSEWLRGRTTLDASGLVVSPGFVDLHQHGQSAENDAVKAADGVTTALELEVGVADIDAWYAARAKNALINFGASIGHIPVRMSVMHDDGELLPSGAAAYRAATSEELQQIEAGIEKGLKRGALAVGLGPAYTPGATNLEVSKHSRLLPATMCRSMCTFEEASRTRTGPSPAFKRHLRTQLQREQHSTSFTSRVQVVQMLFTNLT